MHRKGSVMKLKDFIEKTDMDVDVCTDYSDTFVSESGREMDAYIAFCPGDKLSAEGRAKWADIMDLEVEVVDCDAIVHIPQAPEPVMEKMQTSVMMLFYTFAGFVSEKFYNRMVEEQYD